MKFNILTIFPEIFNILNHGVISKAFEKNLSINCYDIRENAINKHGQIDGKPYGGGEGMLMMAQPLKETLSKISSKDRGHVIYLSPQGKRLSQENVINYSTMKSLTLVCGRYEGVDQRFIDKYVDEEISIGDFILSGGEYAAICLIDAIARNLPGTIGNEDSIKNDSFSNGLLKGPAYTRPEIFEDIKVPDVLLSGNHSKINEWKTQKSLIQTYIRRPDLINELKLTKKQKKLLEEWTSKDIL
jgi:tRNA (guanine37-N1)-methyltransferase|tara:strand:+ start:602 stop:1330 length:729 start_codon:yes stop_codon:yes gene_type:complete